MALKSGRLERFGRMRKKSFEIERVEENGRRKRDFQTAQFERLSERR